MHFFSRILFVFCFLFSSNIAKGVTSKQLLENILWLTNVEIADKKIVAQMKGLVERCHGHRRDHNLDLRSKYKKKIRTYLARLRGRFEDDSSRFNLALGAWFLVDHYSLVDQRWALQGKEYFSDHDCPVCHVEPENAIVLRCGHQLCADCLLRWVTSKSLKELNHRGCPSCRADLGNALRNSLQLHWEYKDLWSKNELVEVAIDHREHMDAQAAFDEQHIHELFGDELEELIRLQEELDAQNAETADEGEDDGIETQEASDDEDDDDRDLEMLGNIFDELDKI